MADGKCGAHHYANIDQSKIDKMLAALREEGATITGNNPWDVDTHNHGIKLQGTWNQGTSTLTIIVTAKGFLVPCYKIWDNIDPLINNLDALVEEESR